MIAVPTRTIADNSVSRGTVITRFRKISSGSDTPTADISNAIAVPIGTPFSSNGNWRISSANF